MGAECGLIIFPGALGDLMCLLPAIEELGRRYPKIEFALMARSELARFAEQRTTIVAGYSIDRREVATLFSKPSSGWKLAHEFFHQFDRIECFLAADNQCFRSSLRLAAKGGVSFYPFRPPGMGHVAECYLRVIGASVTPTLRRPIELLPDDLNGARKKLQGCGLAPGRYILVLPGSGSTHKNWPAENFVQLADKLQPAHRALVVLGPAESALAPAFKSRSASVLSDLELGELAGIARLARCFIGNDSGVSHLAAAAGARGLAIFGPTDPERWRPLGDVEIIRHDPLENLPVDQVWPLVESLIEGTPARR